MVFSSLLFLFWFIPIFFAVYFIVPARSRNTVLFLGSIVFYAWGEPAYLILIFISILVNYLAGLGLAHRDEETAPSVREKTIFILALLFDFGMLFVFKYTGFFVRNINAAFSASIPDPDLGLPLGISFYTFQIASYVIDLYRGKIKAEKNILTLGTYLVMFPQELPGIMVVIIAVLKAFVTKIFLKIRHHDIYSGTVIQSPCRKHHGPCLERLGVDRIRTYLNAACMARCGSVHASDIF